MKKIFLLSTILLFCTVFSFAQAPGEFNYQGVARDASGDVLQTTLINLQVVVHSGSEMGSVVYSETHAPTTNQFGLFNAQIGTGGSQSGTLAGVEWGNGSYYLEVLKHDGTNYVTMGTSQLVSVPYALYAETSSTGGPAGPAGPMGLQGAAGQNGLVGATTGQMSPINGRYNVLDSSI